MIRFALAELLFPVPFFCTKNKTKENPKEKEKKRRKKTKKKKRQMRAQLSHFFTGQPERAKIVQFLCVAPFGNGRSYPDCFEYFDWPQRPLEALREL